MSDITTPGESVLPALTPGPNRQGIKAPVTETQATSEELVEEAIDLKTVSHVVIG